MTVQTETHGRVLVVTIDRPEVRNAVDGPTADLLFETFARLDADHGLDSAVLTGAEGTFCAGADLTAISAGRGNRLDEPPADEIVDAPGPMGPTRLVTAKPVIAAVEGHAVAGGLELALWCDLRVAARDATFGVYCRRWGVPLVDGGTVRLPRLIGHSRAMDLILTGRPVLGPEAVDIGLANRLAEPGAALADAIVLAESLSVFPQGCLRRDRESAIHQWGDDLGGALAREARLGMDTIRSGETLEGASRFAAGAGRGGSFDDLG
ncbi:MAG: crotonase/enoyl-CoA hydratase family protein [Actinomycetota bacterium]